LKSLGRVRPAALLALSAAGLLIALYLSWTRLAGGLPACGPVRGCDTVALSEYSAIVGVPVAYLGAAFSTVLLGAVLVWLGRGERVALQAAYGLATLGVVFVAYLTYLELFVIHAICVWCVGYAVAVVGAWILLAVELRSSLN
jgi:uncharacterized membrane protein